MKEFFMWLCINLICKGDVKMKILSKTCMAGLIALTMSMSSYAEKVNTVSYTHLTLPTKA